MEDSMDSPYKVEKVPGGQIRIQLLMPNPSGVRTECGHVSAFRDETGDRVKISGINVSPPWQGRGFAKGLLSELRKEVDKHVGKSSELYLTQNENPGFWKAMGFEERQRSDGTVEYFKAPTSSAQPNSQTEPLSSTGVSLESQTPSAAAYSVTDSQSPVLNSQPNNQNRLSSSPSTPLGGQIQSVMTYSATDSRLLLRGLIDYRNSLEKHIDQLTAEYQQLEGRWRAFNAVSEGDYADQFRAGWGRTEAQFRAYIDQSQKIRVLINERINDLEDLNRQEGGLP